MENVCIWGFGYGSGYDEATQVKVNELSNVCGIGLITTGRINKIYRKNSNKIIFKRSLTGIALFFLYSLLIMPFRFKKIVIISNPNSPFIFMWTQLLKYRIIHIFSNEYIHNNISEHSFYFRHIFKYTEYVGITCIREKNIIDQQLNSRDSAKTVLFLPFVNDEKYYYCDPPNVSTFTITFASAPMSESAFDSKGIEIMLQGFKKFSDRIDTKLVIIWRRDKNAELLYKTRRLIKNYSLENKVNIINYKIKNMHDIYSNSHCTILVNKNHSDTPNYPQSLLEALSVGRPIITSNINEIAEIILKENVGSICELNGESVYDAMIDCYNNYSIKQSNTKYIVKKYFDFGNITKLNIFL